MSGALRVTFVNTVPPRAINRRPSSWREVSKRDLLEMRMRRMMKAKGYLGCALVCGWAVALGAQATAPKTTWAGVYTKEQSARGESVSDASCAPCHGDKLAGSDIGPALRGTEFLAGWDGRNAAELLEKISSTMPADSPGSLTSQRYIDLVAYMLSANEFPAGDSELLPDPTGLRSLVIAARKP